jgi:hypothetical protein
LVNRFLLVLFVGVFLSMNSSKTYIFSKQSLEEKVDGMEFIAWLNDLINEEEKQ